jgi:hypothetical protein
MLYIYTAVLGVGPTDSSMLGKSSTTELHHQSLQPTILSHFHSFKTRSHCIAQAAQWFCLSLLSARITGVHHHAQFQPISLLKTLEQLPIALRVESERGRDRYWLALQPYLLLWSLLLQLCWSLACFEKLFPSQEGSRLPSAPSSDVTPKSGLLWLPSHCAFHSSLSSPFREPIIKTTWDRGQLKNVVSATREAEIRKITV